MFKIIYRMRKNRSGFTLIELMMLVAILGILASLAVASFGDSSSAKAKVGKIKGDLRTIVSAAEMYKLDNGAYPGDLNTLVSGYLKKIPSGLKIGDINYKYAWDPADKVVVLCTDADSDTIFEEGDTIAQVDMDGVTGDEDASSANL